MISEDYYVIPFILDGNKGFKFPNFLLEFVNKIFILKLKMLVMIKSYLNFHFLFFSNRTVPGCIEERRNFVLETRKKKTIPVALLDHGDPLSKGDFMIY